MRSSSQRLFNFFWINFLNLLPKSINKTPKLDLYGSVKFFSNFSTSSNAKEEKRPWILRARELSVQAGNKLTTPEENNTLPQRLIYISCGWESFKEVLETNHWFHLYTTNKLCLFWFFLTSKQLFRTASHCYLAEHGSWKKHMASTSSPELTGNQFISNNYSMFYIPISAYFYNWCFQHWSLGRIQEKGCNEEKEEIGK